MNPLQCTIDSSCVVALDHLDLLPQMSFLFSRVLVLKAVRHELFKVRSTKKRVQSLFDAYAFFQRCDDYDKVTVDLLLGERRRQGSNARDRGEVEAVVQASQIGANVIVDDRWGRKLAGQFALEHHGTLWILQELYRLQLLSSPTCRASFASLRLRKIRLPWDEVNKFLVEIGEDCL